MTNDVFIVAKEIGKTARQLDARPETQRSKSTDIGEVAGWPSIPSSSWRDSNPTFEPGQPKGQRQNVADRRFRTSGDVVRKPGRTLLRKQGQGDSGIPDIDEIPRGVERSDRHLQWCFPHLHR